MPRGSRPGERRGGRQKGTPNKRTAALRTAIDSAARKLSAELGADCFAGDSHDLLMAVYKDVKLPIALRVDAAKVAIGFEKPKLAATELSGNLGMSHEGRLAFLREAAPQPSVAAKADNGKAH